MMSMCQVGWITKFEEDVSLHWAWTSYTMMQVFSSLIEQPINVVICSVWSSFVKVSQELSSANISVLNYQNVLLYLLAANYLSVMWSQNTQKMSQSFKWWWTRPWPLWMTLNGDLDCDFRSHREKPKSMTRWYLRDPQWQSRDYGPLIVFREAGELKSIQISRCSHWRTFVVFATSLLCTQGHKEGSFL